MFKEARFIISLLFLSFLVIPSGNVFANNLAVSNINFGERDLVNDTIKITFDVSWQNSWRTKINHDAVWLTVRFDDSDTVSSEKTLCSLKASGLSPLGTSAGSNADLELYVPADKKGAFLRFSSFDKSATVSTVGVQLVVDFTSCGFNQDSHVYANVFGIEMIYVPQGAFYAGDYDTSTASLDQGSADVDPWYIASESPISVANSGTNGYRYVSAGSVGEDATGSIFTIPASYPKGYQGFYAMKYELTEGQWVEFFNSLSVNARANHDLTDASHKNSDAVRSRNTISCSGSPITCSTSRPGRAVAYLSWMDLVAFLDWAALRPMTELEFEKMTRGPFMSTPGEFAWGTDSVTAATVISNGDETGAETVTNADANANYNSTTFSGGDTGSGADYQQGPLRGGIFALTSTTRQLSGAGYYGLMELSGNVKERAVTIGNTAGRNFSGSHGDGLLSSDSGFEGNANQTDWPGINATVTRGVTGADGSGYRGGGWNDQSSGNRLRISDRNDAANASTAAANDAGGRGVRTYDGS